MQQRHKQDAACQDAGLRKPADYRGESDGYLAIGWSVQVRLGRRAAADRRGASLGRSAASE